MNQHLSKFKSFYFILIAIFPVIAGGYRLQENQSVFQVRLTHVEESRAEDCEINNTDHKVIIEKLDKIFICLGGRLK